MIKPRNRAAGTAIFMAMLIVAIVAGITVALMQTQKVDIRRTQLMFNSEQTYLYSQGIIAWAKGAILTSLQNPQATTWPIVLPPTSIASGTGKIAGTLQDAQSLFNINNFQLQQTAPPNPQQQQQIQQKKAQAQLPPSEATGTQGQNNPVILTNLLSELRVQMGPDQINMLVQAITAWNSKPVSTTGNLLDTFDNQYMQKNPSYRAPHAPMVSVSELRLVEGITPEVYEALLPYLVALPTKTTINPKFAPQPLQKALGVIQGQTPETQQQAAGNLSNYFLLRGDVYLSNQHMVLYALLQRGTPNSPGQTPAGAPPQPNPDQPAQLPDASQAQKLAVTVLWTSFGTQ